jgi:hypothetical protein
MNTDKLTLAQFKNKFQPDYGALEGEAQIIDSNSSTPELTREELLADMNQDLNILVQRIWGESKVSKNGNKYSVAYCTYMPLGGGTPLTYQAAVFSPAGKLIVRNMWEGHKYRVKTVLSDRGYDEWTNVEEIL